MWYLGTDSYAAVSDSPESSSPEDWSHPSTQWGIVRKGTAEQILGVFCLREVV
jgi:hypothetical protein